MMQAVPWLEYHITDKTCIFCLAQSLVFAQVYMNNSTFYVVLEFISDANFENLEKDCNQLLKTCNADPTPSLSF